MLKRRYFALKGIQYNQNNFEHFKQINICCVRVEVPFKALSVPWKLSVISWGFAFESNDWISVPLFLTSGVYAAAYDANIEWVVVKVVASYFHQSHSATSEWLSFASTMAASVVAKMLSDPTVFREWPHYNQGKPHHWKSWF